MVQLKYKKKPQQINEKVTILQKIDETNTPLKYVKMKVISFKEGGIFKEALQGLEVCIVALTGQISVTDYSEAYKKIGRRTSVFEKIPTDSVYISINQRFQIKADSESVVVLCYSPAQKQLPTQLILAEDNLIEERGQYQNKRTVHNILADESTIANSLLVVEVFTDSGNWSSYPPHKHDQDDLPRESLLEETYYHEVMPRQGFIVQRVYTDDRELDETMTVENQEVVVVPKGYHPVGVPDGYASYYLNIMAGPRKKWQFYNDPEHEWILKRE